MAFATKRITPTIALGTVSTPTVASTFGPVAPQPQQTFGAAGNTVTWAGLRCHVDIQSGGGQAQGAAHCRFYGLTPSILNQLSALSLQIIGQTVKNALSIAAGDDVNGVATLFTGQIVESWVDASSEPEVCLILSAMAGGATAVLPAPVRSYPGVVDVAVILQTLATQQGWAFENSGVSVFLATPYLWGSVQSQIDTIAAAAHIECTVDEHTAPNTLAIWPKGGARKPSGAIPVISPATGMLGSPQFNANGVNVTMLFNPTLRYGTQVRIESQVLAATGLYYITGVWHALDSETTGGAWFTTISCAVNPNSSNPGG